MQHLGYLANYGAHRLRTRKMAFWARNAKTWFTPTLQHPAESAVVAASAVVTAEAAATPAAAAVAATAVG